jgi:Tfp pilus assembly protein PilN
VLGRRRGDVRIAIWGLRGTHQAFQLPDADAGDLVVLARREARQKDRTWTPAVGGLVADAVLTGEHGHGGLRNVGYVSVPPGELQARLQPFLDAGITFASVVTPAVAHAQIVRRRWGHAGAPATAVLAVNANATAITIVRGGVVLFARELPWGFETDRAAGGVIDAPSCAGRLASELRRSIVFLSQQSKTEVSHLLVCGEMPDLRVLTAPLQQDTNLQVETLDTADDADAAVMGVSPTEQRTRAATLRTAWTLAAVGGVSMSLQPREAQAPRMGASFDQQGQRRLAAGILAAMVLVVAAWGGTAWLTARSRDRVEVLRRKVAVLTADVQRVDEGRQATALTRARVAALGAFESQGPRLARVLEALAAATPGDVVLTSVTAAPATGAWRVTIEGQARADTPARAQALFSDFLRSAAASSWLGAPVRTPVMNVQTSEPDSAGGASQRAVQAQPEPHWSLRDAGPGTVVEPPAAAVAPAPGTLDHGAGSVLTFSVEFEVRK